MTTAIDSVSVLDTGGWIGLIMAASTTASVHRGTADHYGRSGGRYWGLSCCGWVPSVWGSPLVRACLQKKSKAGIATAKEEIDVVRERFKRLKERLQ